ncbi:hypothetical protein ScPMuIL_002387 [Solemya velum]
MFGPIVLCLGLLLPPWCGANGEQCGCPPEFPNAEAEYTELANGFFVGYSCVEGYESTISELTLGCLEDGSWSTGNIVCSVPDCGQPPEVPNADISEGETSIGSTRIYTCQSDFYMWGEPNSITCLEDGSWSDTTIGCHLVINVALKRAASQSSTHETCEASNAVDGGKRDEYLYCSHTKEDDPAAWWMVNFGAEAVVIETRLANLDIFVGTDATHVAQCAHFDGPGGPSSIEMILCTAPVSGRFLRITGGGADCSSLSYKYPILTLCEVEVIGFFPTPIECDAQSFQCLTMLCIPISEQCNQVDECGDYSDEEGCPCAAGWFKCPDTFDCITGEWVCDGIIDCGSGADEEECGSSLYRNLKSDIL